MLLKKELNLKSLKQFIIYLFNLEKKYIKIIKLKLKKKQESQKKNLGDNTIHTGKPKPNFI